MGYKSTDLVMLCPNIFSTLSLSLAERYLFDLLFSRSVAHETMKKIRIKENSFSVLTLNLLVLVLGCLDTFDLAL